MPNKDPWDWKFLYYVGTVILQMSELQFWRSTPRKLAALTAVHIEINSSKEGKRPVDGNGQVVQRGYIDQVL